VGTDNNTRYYVSVAFATLVFVAGFYSLVIYEFTLTELIQGAFISLMTLAVQYVLGEQSAASTARRVRQSYEAGSAASGGPTVTAEGADTVTVEPTEATSERTGTRG
jgi:hypothetical protein